jgi:hypothetical protein
MWFGWISCARSEGKFLRGLSITLGKYDRTMEVYSDCIVSGKAKRMIDKANQRTLAARTPPRFIYLLDFYKEQKA